jgi:hypothetical protein
MALKVFDALWRLDPNAFISGNPSAGEMRVVFDGEFNLLDFVRALNK